jgi:hypothetical protein
LAWNPQAGEHRSGSSGLAGKACDQGGGFRVKQRPQGSRNLLCGVGKPDHHGECLRSAPQPAEELAAARCTMGQLSIVQVTATGCAGRLLGHIAGLLRRAGQPAGDERSIAAGRDDG